MRACATIRVLEVGHQFGVTSLCGQLFAGLGATVVVARARQTIAKASVRSPEAEAYAQLLLHEGKSLHDGDAETLVGDADIVLIDRNNGEPSPAWARPDVFASRWPGKILCVVSLFGEGGPQSSWLGNELVAEAAGALMACNGYPERLPVTSGLPYALHTAALFAFNAVLTALRDRDQSGQGQVIDLAIVDCIVAILGNFLPSYFLSGKSPKRIGNRHTIAAPWNIYPALDGTVVICTGTGGTGWWAKVMGVLERPELIHDPRFVTEADRVRNVEEVDTIVGDWTAQRSMRETVERFTAAGLPVSEISTIEAVLTDPHYRELRRMVRGEMAGQLPGVGIPLKVGAWVDDAAPGPRAPASARAPVGAPGPRALVGATAASQPSGHAEQNGTRPLGGLRILEFASRTSVPLAGRLMTDFGAEVVKIEPPKGDALRGAGQQIGGASYLFHINNAGKKSIMIDPASEAGRSLILNLVRESDVFMENLAPGSLEKMGLDYEALKAVNPNILYCSVSGFGGRSAYGSKRALDTVVQAACGLMHMTGYPDHHPVKLGISAVDLTTATATMAAILVGLRERQATGHGSYIDLAMADIGIWMTQHSWPQLLVEGEHPIRLGNRSPNASPHNVFPAADGKLVAIAVENDEQWRSFVGVINRDELRVADYAMASGRLAHQDAIESIVSEWASARDAMAAAIICQSAGVPAAVVRDLVELCGDPEVARRRMIFEIQHPTAGPIRLLGNPMALSRTPARIGRGAPLLGEHTREVLSDWLHLDDGNIDALERAGYIRTQPIRQATQTSAMLANVQAEG